MKLSTKAPKVYINGGMKSASAKRVAVALREKLGYKVVRTNKILVKRKALKYGQGVDKLTQYKWFQAQGLPSLEFTTDPAQVKAWIDNDKTVFGRSLLNASCGKGIHVLDMMDHWDGFVQCPVYTLYKKKKREFRVHVFKDKVVRVVEKKLRSNWNGPRESKIRNLANGFVFCSCNSEPDGLRELAIKAGGVVSSDFKGVDIGFNEKSNQLFVIEVNSAPGIEGSNVEAYTNIILKDI